MHGDYYVMCAVVAVVTVCLVIAAILMTLYVIYHYLLRGLLARTTTVPATVVRKTQREYGGASSSYDDDDLLMQGADVATSGLDLFVLFDVRGKRLEFAVPERVYIDVDEGDAGLLTHKGTLFRRFLKDAQFQAQSGRTMIRKV